VIPYWHVSSGSGEAFANCYRLLRLRYFAVETQVTDEVSFVVAVVNKID